MTITERIAVTGASGFVGRALMPVLATRGVPLDRATLGRSVNDVAETLLNCAAVIHLAGRAHRFGDQNMDDYMTDNVALTDHVLNAARNAGVKRFVFVSTIGVHGNATHGQPFRESDTPAPHNPYTKSKLLAEEHVRVFCAAHHMDWCIIRPPLVYGLDAPGNIGTLQKLIRLGVPLPFKNCGNRRSLIAVDYLARILEWAAAAPNAANRIFVVSDGIDRSTGGILQTLAAQMGTRVRLFAFPQKILRFTFGKRLAPLWDDLQVDATAVHTAMQDSVNSQDRMSA